MKFFDKLYGFGKFSLGYHQHFQTTTTTVPPAKACEKQKTDLIFLLDGSSSIGEDLFKDDVLKFVHKFADLFEIGPDSTRAGVIQYSTRNRMEFPLNQYVQKNTLLKAIDQIQYLRGGTS
jgi:hypothetical protein